MWANAISSNNRNWRFHKQEKQWLTKDVHFAEPQRIPDGSGEYGTYIFFDERTWEKKRVSHLLVLRHCFLEC